MSERIVFQFEIGGHFQGNKTLTIRETPIGPACEYACWPKPEGSDRRTLPITNGQMKKIDALATRCGVSG